MRYIKFLCLLISFPVFGQIAFSDLSTDAGIGVSPGTTFLGNGISFVDYNNDGWDDITICSEYSSPLRFFKNVNGSFVEEQLLTPPITYQTKQTNWVDFDNDGDKDLFVTSDTDGVRLYQNIGGSTFNDITVSAGFPITNMYTYGASWGDYNNDGYLDVYVSNRDEVTFSIPNFLYRNNGDGTFTDVSVTSGLNPDAHSSFCSAFFDFNNDGYQDIFVANDRYVFENYLYKNNGDGTFTDVGASSGVGLFMDAMSATVGDFNHDGWFDLYVTNTATPGNVFFMNNGNETFTNIAAITNTEFNAIGWGAVFLDVENDMDLDLYVSGKQDGNPALIPYAFYENNNDGTFSEPTSTGLEIDDRSSYANAIADYNNDGLVDIVVSNDLDQNIFLWKNETINSNNWLKVNLEGVTSNKDGVGSVIEISINGNKQYRYTLCGEGYLSQNSNTEFFGLGVNTEVDYIKVTWLSGTVDIFNNISANQTLNIIEGAETLTQNNYIRNVFQLFPNPTNNVINLKSSIEIQSYELFDLNGNTVFLSEYDKNLAIIDLTYLSSGVYFLKVSSVSKVEVFKVVKE